MFLNLAPESGSATHFTRTVKGIVSRDLLTLVFSSEQLLLVLLDMHKKDFEFYRIFAELVVFVIDSPVYSSRDEYTGVLT